MIRLESYRGTYIDLSGLTWEHIDRERDKIGNRYPFRVTRFIYRCVIFLPPSIEELAKREREKEGLRNYSSELGRRGGKVKSEVKSTTARENGKKGGRPSKQLDIDDI